MKEDKLIIGGHEFESRFILGSGKYNVELIDAAIRQAKAEIITPVSYTHLDVYKRQIMNHINVLEHIMAGAAAGGIATGILLNGYGLVGKVIEDLEAWLRGHDVKRIEDIRGAALGGLKSFEEIKTEAKGAVIATDCSRPDCGKCEACCLEDAISTKDGHIMIDKGLCSGCGLCLDVCPYDKIKLTWK